MGIRLTTEEFINKAILTHGYKYNYEQVNYINNRTKVKIICSNHGVFEQIPDSHMRGQGCNKCANKNVTNYDLINKGNIIHNNKYDYSLVDYNKCSIKIKIICPEHGEFEQTPNEHLQGNGCAKCNGYNKINLIDFINKSNLAHNERYNYSLVNNLTNNNLIDIICPYHGEFKQRPHDHMSGHGCIKCGGQYTYDTEEFIIKSTKIHGKKFDYSLSTYVNSGTKLKIICLKHGEFEQTPNNHLSSKQGCPTCNESKGERQIRDFLIKNDIKFIAQKRFNDCINPKTNRKLPFDFYIPKLNVCIEFQGLQHYEPITYFGGESGLINRQYRDKLKDNYCDNKKLNLIIINFDDNIIESLNNLLINYTTIYNKIYA